MYLVYIRGRIFPMHGKFSQVSSILEKAGVREGSTDAALIDCGASSMQFDVAERGFSVKKDGPLDMRIGTNS